MNVRGYVKIHPSRLFIELNQLMTSKQVVIGIMVFEEFRRSLFLGMNQGMSRDEVVLQKVLLDSIIEIIVSLSYVGKGESTTSVVWGQIMDQEERVTCASWIETGVDMEDEIALHIFSI